MYVFINPFQPVFSSLCDSPLNGVQNFSNVWQVHGLRHQGQTTNPLDSLLESRRRLPGKKKSRRLGKLGHELLEGLDS